MSSDVLEELRGELRSLNMAELSEVSGLPAWRLRELVNKGKGPPHFRVGMTYRFPVVEVRKWFAELTITHGAPQVEAERAQVRKIAESFARKRRA